MCPEQRSKGPEGGTSAHVYEETGTAATTVGLSILEFLDVCALTLLNSFSWVVVGG